MTHYYTNNKDLNSKPKEFDYYFYNEVFYFITDNGVFSKKNIDYGSYILIKTIYLNDLGKRLLDYGSGYGPIGIIIKRFNEDIDIEMVDVNPRAVDLSNLNCKKNNVDIKVHLCDDITKLENKFDTIVLNPPIRAGKKIIYEMYEKANNMLNDNGHFYIVIKKAHGANSSISELMKLFKNVVTINKDSGYLVIDSYN